MLRTFEVERTIVMKFKMISSCRMCGSKNSEFYYETLFGGSDDKDHLIDRCVEVVKCSCCGFIYSKECMTDDAANEFWNHYASDVHQCDDEANTKRKQMYHLEYDYISRFFIEKQSKSVLDVGCSNGGFLECFYNDGWDCYGVEIDEENGELVNNDIEVYIDEFPHIDFGNQKFDLIVFRGTIIYFDEPKLYFEKALEELKPGGCIFITSTPDPESYCYRLFAGKSKIPVCGIAQNGFSKDYLVRYFEDKGLVLLGDRCFYEETPYANIEQDVATVYRAIKYNKEKKEIDFACPPFWGNMVSLVFKKL